MTSENVPKCQKYDGTLRYGRVVPHPAPKNVKKKVLGMACGCIQNYSHINYDPFPPIQILPSPI